MNSPNTQDLSAPRAASGWPWLMGLCALSIGLAILLLPRPRETPVEPTQAAAGSAMPLAAAENPRATRPLSPRPRTDPVAVRSAGEIVMEKVSQFARHHEELVASMAKHFQVPVPVEVNRFFAAMQAGRWEETTNLFAALLEYRKSDNSSPGLEKLWPAVTEAYGVAEAAHNWPAQQLLDYGNAILGSLRPDMVYVGGTDPGRFIPTLLNETSEGHQHIMLTQTALADRSYLDYLQFRYGDRLNALTGEDSQSGFQTYLADAQKRLQHDQAYPDEPRQLRPGEDVRVSENRVQVSGQVAVMAINEQLLQTLLQKNPTLAFALEESFPLKSFYAGATTLGPLTELRADADSNPLTHDTAAQSLDYWRATTQTLLSDSSTTDVSRNAYAKLILGQANLFLDRNFASEAEHAFQLGNQLSPADPEGVFSYINLLVGQNRMSEARQVAQTALDLAPENAQFRSLLDQLRSK